MIETLEKQEKDKRCFRLVGGVLVERKVGEVEPALVSNRDKVRLILIFLKRFLKLKNKAHLQNNLRVNILNGFN